MYIIYYSKRQSDIVIILTVELIYNRLQCTHNIRNKILQYTMDRQGSFSGCLETGSKMASFELKGSMW